MAADVQFKAALDMGDVAAALATLPTMTGKEAKKAVALMEKAFKKAATEAKKATTAQRQMAREAEKANRDLAEGMKGLAEMAGLSGESFEKLSKVLSGMSNPLTGIAVGAAAGVVAIGGLAAGVVGLVQASAELAQELEPYRELAAFQGIGEEGIESIHRAGDAMDAMNVSAKISVVLLGEQFAPAVNEAATGLLTFQLAANSLASDLSGGSPLASFIADIFKEATVLGQVVKLTGQVFEIAAIGVEDYRDEAEELIAKVAELREEQEAEKESAAKSAQAKRDQAAATREAAAAAREQASALNALTSIATKAFQDQLEGANLVIAKRDQELAKIEELAAKAGDSAEAVRAAEEARVEVIAAAEMAVNEIYSDAAQERADLAAKQEAERKAEHARELARIEKEAAAALAADMAKLSTAESVFASLDALSQAATDAYVAGKGEESAAAKQAAQNQFRLSKALNIAQAGLNTAQAVLASIGSLGPPVWPNVQGIAGVAAAVGIGAAGIVSIAATPPPTFHTGGSIGQSGSPAPDEMTVRARRGEAILNPGAVDRAGGEAGINAMNDGGGAGTTIVVEQRYKHRSFGAFVDDNVRISGSPLNRELRRGRRSGRRGK